MYKYEWAGNRYVRIRFLDVSNREWVRDLNGALRRGENVPVMGAEPEKYREHAMLIPPARSIDFSEVPRAPIKGCVPG